MIARRPHIAATARDARNSKQGSEGKNISHLPTMISGARDCQKEANDSDGRCPMAARSVTAEVMMPSRPSDEQQRTPAKQREEAISGVADTCH